MHYVVLYSLPQTRVALSRKWESTSIARTLSAAIAWQLLFSLIPATVNETYSLHPLTGLIVCVNEPVMNVWREKLPKVKLQLSPCKL